MSRVLLRLVLFGVMGSAVAPVPALAQPAPAVDKKQVARQYTEAGLAAAKLGDYDTAIGFYSKAYQLVPHPTLIFDIAEAHRLAGRVDQAMTLYRRYLTDAPNGPLAQDARDRIAEVEAKKAEEAKEEAKKVEDARRAEDDRKAAERKAEDDRRAAERKAEDDRRAAEARRTEDARRAAEARKAEQARQATATAPGQPGQDRGSPEVAAPPGRNLRIAGLATGAAGFAGVVVGIGFGLHARSLADELSRPMAVYDPSKVDAGHRANAIAIVGMAGGTALVAAGAALYWWGYTQGQSTERISLAPLMSDRAAGLVVAGTWR